MSTVLALKRLVSRVLPTHNEAPSHDGVVGATRAALRQTQAAKAEAEAALAVAQERVKRAELSANATAAANTAANAARNARVSFVQAFMERGELMPIDGDVELREAAESASRHLAQVEVQGAAARGALPALRARVQEAKEDIKRAESRIDEAIGEVLIATVYSLTREVGELIEHLNPLIAKRIAVLDLMNRRAFYGAKLLASVPTDLIPVPRMKFSDDQLIENVRPWAEYARRLREDPDAPFIA